MVVERSRPWNCKHFVGSVFVVVFGVLGGGCRKRYFTLMHFVVEAMGSRKSSEGLNLIKIRDAYDNAL